MVVKKFDDMLSRFDIIPACDIETGGVGDKQISCESIVRAMHSIER